MLARLCYITNFLLAASLGVGFVFIDDVQKANGLTDWEIGLIVSAGFVAALITQLLLAPLADRGRISLLVWVSILAGSCGGIGFAFVSETWLLIVTRGMVGIGLGLFSVTARKALIGLDATGGGEKVGALLSTGVGGFIAGPVIGLAFKSVAFEAPFIIVGIAIAVIGPFTARYVAAEPIAIADVDYSDVGELIRRPRVQVAMLVQFTVFSFIGVFDSTIDRYLTDLGASDLTTTIVILAVGAPILILAVRMGALAERIGGVRVIVPAFVVMVATMGLFGLAPSPLFLALVGAVYGGAEASASMGGQVLVLEASGAERVAIGSAILETVGLLTATITALVGPLVYGARGETWLFGGLALMSAVILLLVLQRIRSMDRVDAAPLAKAL